MRTHRPPLIHILHFPARQYLAIAAPLLAVVEALVELLDLAFRSACLVSRFDPAVVGGGCLVARQDLAVVAPFVAEVCAGREWGRLGIGDAAECGGCEPEGGEEGEGEVHGEF